MESEFDDAIENVGRLTTPDELKERGVVRLRSVSRSVVVQMVRDAVETAVRQQQTEANSAGTVRENATVEVQERLRSVLRPRRAEAQTELERNVTLFIQEHFQLLATEQEDASTAQDEIVTEVGIALRTTSEQATLRGRREGADEREKLERRLQKLVQEHEELQAEASRLRGQNAGWASGGRRVTDEKELSPAKAKMLNQLFASNRDDVSDKGRDRSA